MSVLTWTTIPGYIDTGAISGALAIKPPFTFAYDSLYYEPADNNTFYTINGERKMLTDANILEITKYMITFTGNDLQVQGVDASGKYLGFVARNTVATIVDMPPPKDLGFYRYDLTTKTYVRIYGVDSSGKYLGNVELGTYFQDVGSPPPRTDITMVWDFTDNVWKDTRPTADITAETLKSVMVAYEQQVTDYLNNVAKSKGYDDMVSMCSYASAPNKYQAEAIAFLTWRAVIWDYCTQLFANASAPGSVISIPTFEAVKAGFPPMPVV